MHDHTTTLASEPASQSLPGASAFSHALQDALLESPDIGAFLADLSRHAATILSVPDSELYCAILLVRPRKKTTMASSSPEATAMDEIQFRYNDGPCLRAAREHAQCVVDDFETETRFGPYTNSILATGIRSALGTPITLDGDATASMNLYATRPHVFDADRSQAALQVAEEASRTLRTAVQIAHLSDEATDLKSAMDSRATIQIATGIIMGQNRCSHEVAMTILKAASSSRNLKLSAVAAAVLRSIGQEPPIAHFDS